MAFEIKGKIEVLSDTQQVTEKFKKREFVLMVEEGMYPEYIKFQAVQDRCNLLDNYKIGEIVTVSFNLRGRPYTKDGKTTYFTNLDAWRISAAQEAQTPAPPVAAVAVPQATTQSATEGVTFSDSEEDDLPF